MTTIVYMCRIALWVLTLQAAPAHGLPYGPHPPDTESGFSFKNFKDFIMAGINRETHTHDPAEMYLHKGQKPAVAEVGIAIPAGEQVLLAENEKGVGSQGDTLAANRNDGQPAETILVVAENGEVIEKKQGPKPGEEAVETLDVPHEHPKMEFSDVIGDKNLVAGEQVREGLPDAKVAIREEI